MKAFIESHFAYCPLIWMFHSRSLNNKINRLHERALRLVYKDSHLSFRELLKKDHSFSIHHRNLQKLAVEMYKLVNNISTEPMKSIFIPRNVPYNLRGKNPFQSRNIKSVRNGTETLSYRGLITWTIVPDEMKNSISLIEFKSKIKNLEPTGCTCRLRKTYVHNVGFIN